MKKSLLVKVGLSLLVVLIGVSLIFVLRPKGNAAGQFKLQIIDIDETVLVDKKFNYDDEQSLFDFLNNTYTITFTDYGEMGKFINTITIGDKVLPGEVAGTYLAFNQIIDDVEEMMMVGASSYYLNDNDIIVIRVVVYEG